MGKSQRTKGHSWERKVAQCLRVLGFSNARRHLEYQDSEANGIDLVETGQFAVQCKNMAKMPNIPKVFKEIKCDEEDIPVVVFKVTNKGEYACFKWEDAQLMMSYFQSWSDGDWSVKE